MLLGSLVPWYKCSGMEPMVLWSRYGMLVECSLWPGKPVSQPVGLQGTS